MPQKEPRRFSLRSLLNLVPFFFFMAIGAACGVLITRYADVVISKNPSAGFPFAPMLALFVSMYVFLYLHLIIHEAGHLVFGLLTGYRFSSFRIGSLMLVRTDGKLAFKRLSLAGTGGQCLMTPPDLIDGKIPFVLYNLGGSLMNLFTSLLALLLTFPLRGMPLLSMLPWIFAVVGIALALMNGIPMPMGMVHNDGCNAVSMAKSPAALRAFWIQLKVNEATSQGIRLKDLPDQWFELPGGGDLKNSMVMTIAVFACNRLMDAQNFDVAREKIDALLHGAQPIIGLYRHLLICDRLYCEWIGASNADVIDALNTKAQRKFMKSMKTFPTVIRTNYVCALLHEHDAAKAMQYKAQFEKCAAKYPYASDIESERELIAYAEKMQ